MKQKKSTVTSVIGKLSVSFLAPSSKHPSVGNYPRQLNLQKSQRILRQRAVSKNVILLLFSSNWGLTAWNHLQSHFCARWSEYHNSVWFIIFDENISKSSGHYINLVKKNECFYKDVEWSLIRYKRLKISSGTFCIKKRNPNTKKIF